MNAMMSAAESKAEYRKRDVSSAPWYETAFGAHYLKVYAHRSREQAEREIGFIVRTLEMAGTERILDICCGAGRHVLALAARGYAVTGIDRSPDLLAAAAGARTSEPADFLRRTATMVGYKLNPTVRFTIDDRHCPEMGLSAVFVEPCQQFLKMNINGKRLWFINELKTRFEGQDMNSSTATVFVSGTLHAYQGTRVCFRTERRSNLFPVGRQTVEEFNTEVGPVVQLVH